MHQNLFIIKSFIKNSAVLEQQPDDEQAADETLLDWVDPRSRQDRRQCHDPSKIPESGCRRKKDRRSGHTNKDLDWWLHRQYNNHEK